MKKLTLVLDGAAPGEMRGLPGFGEPTMLVQRTPPGFAPDSLCCIGTLLGLPAEKIPAGRAWLEALACGVPVGPDDLVFRCSAVRIENGVLTDCRQPVAERAAGFEHLYVLEEGGGCKALLVVPGARPALESLHTFAPHQNLGQPIARLAPSAPAGLRTLFGRLLERGLYAWGEAAETPLPAYFSLHGARGAAVAATGIVRGLAAAMDMACPALPGCTGDVDTDLDAKGRAAAELLCTHDFVLVHVNGTDEASHRRDPSGKNVFLRRICRQLLPVLAAQPACFTVTADHVTDAATGCHTLQPVAEYRWNTARSAALRRALE